MLFGTDLVVSDKEVGFGGFGVAPSSLLVFLKLFMGRARGRVGVVDMGV